jgi:hypothetical protein
VHNKRFVIFVAIVDIVVVMLTMAELGARYEKKQGIAPSVPAPALLVAASIAPAPQAAPAVASAAAPNAGTTSPKPVSPAPRQAAQGEH